MTCEPRPQECGKIVGLKEEALEMHNVSMLPMRSLREEAEGSGAGKSIAARALGRLSMAIAFCITARAAWAT